MKPQLIDTKETAKRLDITRAAVVKQVHAGKLKYALKAPGLRGAFFFDPRIIDRIAADKTRGTAA